MNTPPPSTSTPPPSTSSPAAGSGVQAPDGYQTNTDQMSSAGRNISTKAEDAKGEVDEVKPAKVKATEFGKHEDHQAWHGDYSAALDALGTGAAAMCDNLVAFAGQLGGAGSTYSASDSSAQNTVNQSGSGL